LLRGSPDPEKPLCLNMQSLAEESDETLYHDLFLTYYPPLTAFAFKFVSDRESAKDIVQSVFINLFEKRESLKINHSIKSYLYKAVSNACINHRHQEAVRLKHHGDYSKNISESSFQDAIEQTEEEFKIYQAIEKLPPQCRKVFILSRLESRKNQEIAAKLSISIRTVETHISNALRILRKSINLLFIF
jgi:RNA polymerase sigma-70 factor (ECF subfamily)